MDWFGVFANNLADSVFMPFVLLTVIALAVSYQAFEERTKRRYEYLSQGYEDTTWRMHAGMHGIIAMWCVWGLLAAVPEPNYTYKTITKEVVKEVNVATNYMDAYKSCRYNMDYGRGAKFDMLEDKVCNERSMAFVNLKPIKQVEIREVVKKLPLAREVRYRALFNTCMGKDLLEGGWSVEDGSKPAADFRQERIQLCHAQAKEVIDA